MTYLRIPPRNPLRVARASARVALLTSVWMGWGGQGLGAYQAPEVSTGWEPQEAQLQAVEEDLAMRWGVTPESLVLEWGTPRGGSIPASFQEVELVGSGRDGRWVVTFRETAGSRDSRSVLLRAGIRIPVPVAQQALERNAVLKAEDMASELRTHWGPLPASEAVPQPGWVAQRRIETGEVLSEPALRPPLLVVSGRPVRAIWSNGKVSLTVQATAVGSGFLGERIFVRTEEGTRLDAIVQGPGEVILSSSWTEGGK